MVYWISLPVGWKLQDIQAALSVVIAFLCTGGVFVLVRFFWVRAARHVIKKKHAIPTHTLLSLNTVGEVIDVISLLRGDLFTTEYIHIVIQSICILLLTAASLLSALLARYSTRAPLLPMPRQVSGFLAERNLQSGSVGIVANQTLSALRRANFPPNQLLDFLPDPEVEWEYQLDQWTNSSWSMDCTHIELNEVPHANVQDCSGNVLDEIPYLNHLFSDWPETGWLMATAGSGFENSPTVWEDYNLFLHATWGINSCDNETMSTGYGYLCPMKEINVKTFWIHLKDVGRHGGDADCRLRRSHASLLRYTGMSCKLVRNTTELPSQDKFMSPGAIHDIAGAAPDAAYVQSIALAYHDQYTPRLIRESIEDLPITVIPGEELTQYYQAALLTKDTLLSSQHKTSRIINVYTPITQVSLICLILCCFGTFVVSLGLIHYYLFVFRYRGSLHDVPQSKLDWMVKNLKLENEQKEREKDMKQAYLMSPGSKIGTEFSTTSTLVTHRKGDMAASLAESSQSECGRQVSVRTNSREDSSLMESDSAGTRGWRHE